MTDMRQLALETLDNLKAQDIVTIDVQAITPISDYFIICTGRSLRHIQSMADHLAQTAKDHGSPALGVEGRQNADWILVDLNEVIVHIMLQEARDFYKLEKLWQNTSDSNLQQAQQS